MSNFENNFYGNVSEVQIQQGTTNSVQNKSIDNNADYEMIANVVKEIMKYRSVVEMEFGSSASEFVQKLDEIDELARRRENPSRMKILLDDLKNLAMGVSGSLIASGIYSQLQILLG